MPSAPNPFVKDSSELREKRARLRRTEDRLRFLRALDTHDYSDRLRADLRMALNTLTDVELLVGNLPALQLIEERLDREADADAFISILTDHPTALNSFPGIRAVIESYCVEHLQKEFDRLGHEVENETRRNQGYAVKDWPRPSAPQPTPAPEARNNQVLTFRTASRR